MYKLLFIFLLLFTGCQHQLNLHQRTPLSKPTVIFLFDNSSSFTSKQIQNIQKIFVDVLNTMKKPQLTYKILNNTTQSQDFTSTNNLQLSKCSNISKLLLKTKKLLHGSKYPIYIILLSNHNQQCNNSTLIEMQRLLTYHPNLHMYTIDYKTSYSYCKTLQEIASISNGKYYVVTTPTQFKTQLQTIFQYINRSLHIQEKTKPKSLYTFHFQYGSTNLLPKDKEKLQQVANYIQNHYYNVEIQGHTDSKGSKKYNKEVSLKRAKLVAKKLIDLGIDPSTIKKITGYGETKPIASNETEEGRKINRRVEIYLIK